LHEAGKSQEATAFFRKAMRQYRRALKGEPNFRVLNNFAWFLATCPQTQFQDARRAVQLARKAVALCPQMATLWNTLGVACYRAADWQGAIRAREKSMDLNSGGESFDWFFLAMAHWQLGHKEEARRWYRKAVQKIQKNNLMLEPLARYRSEAAALLGMNDEQARLGPRQPPGKGTD